MRYLYPLLLLVLLVTCKKKDDGPDPVPPGEVKQDLPAGVLSFTIDDVPQENIRFATIEQNGPHHNRIMVTLPTNYPKGDELIARIKLSKNYILRDFYLNEFDPGALKLTYAKTGSLWLFIYDKATDTNIGDFYLYVDPTVPLTAPSVGKNYEETLAGQNVYLYLPVENLGTAETITADNQWIMNVAIMIRNKKTGKVTASYGAYYLENPNNDLFAIIPAETEAGEYELTVQKQNRKVIIPDALILKYGDPVVRMWPLSSVSMDTSKSISYSGYNLLPERKYTMELKNDFTKPVQLTLSSTSHLALKQDIPASFPSGNYEATLFIDGKEMPSYWEYNRNILEIKKESTQPTLLTLSNEKNAVYGEATLYKAITTFKKSETLIADIRGGGGSNMILVLKNIASGKVYELPYSGKTETFIPFSKFEISQDVPAGKYEVSTRHVDIFSERYHKIITIE